MSLDLQKGICTCLSSGSWIFGDSNCLRATAEKKDNLFLCFSSYGFERIRQPYVAGSVSAMPVQGIQQWLRFTKYSEVCSQTPSTVLSDISFHRIIHWVEKICSTHTTMWCWMLDDILAYLDVKRRADIPEYSGVFAVLYTPVAAQILYWNPFFLQQSTVKFNQRLFHQHLPQCIFCRWCWVKHWH